MISAYTISREPVEWKMKEIPHLNLDKPEVKANVYEKPYEYVKELSEKRNLAVTALLEKYPGTSLVLCCDSSYVNQTEALQRLIYDYQVDPWERILGGAIWGRQIMRAKDVFFHRKPRWCDGWGVPELIPLEYEDYKSRTDSQRVKSVSGIHIFPRTAWDQGVRYGAYEDTDRGTETSYFAHHAIGIPSYIDFAARFFRERVYSTLKCFHVSIGLRSRLKGRMRS